MNMKSYDCEFNYSKKRGDKLGAFLSESHPGGLLHIPRDIWPYLVVAVPSVLVSRAVPIRSAVPFDRA